MATRTSRFLLGMVLLLTIALMLLGLSLWQQFRRDQTSSQFAITVTQTVLTNATAEPLIGNAHPDLLAEIDRNGLQGYVTYIVRQLGELQSLEAISGGSSGSWLPFSGQPATASYRISLQFAEQPATAELSLEQLNGNWLIRQFRIAADLLYE